MNEEKKVPFKWEYGEETISLQLGMYANNQRLYIGMITHTEDGAEPFAAVSYTHLFRLAQTVSTNSSTISFRSSR